MICVSFGMKFIAIILISSFIFSESTNNQKPFQISTTSNNNFAFDLYPLLVNKVIDDIEDTTKNVFFSPYSISSAFSLVAEGATGNNAIEIAKALRYPNYNLDNDSTLYMHDIHSGISFINKEFLNKKGNYDLDIANSIWYEKSWSHRFRKTFFDTLNKYYEPSLYEANFKGNYERERKRINNWIEEKTKDKIKELLPEKSLSDETRMVLCNAVYFKSDWLNKFDKKNTRDEPFYLENGDTTTVEMMSKLISTNFGNFDKMGNPWFGHGDKGFQILELPYVNNEISMLIILPVNIPLANLEKMLNNTNLNKWYLNTYKTKVNVSMPKFKIKMEESWSLRSELYSMGMKDAFKSKYGLFLGIADSIYISDVLHKTFIEIDESGTEAAAATAIIMNVVSASPPEPPKFIANHPFIFIIRDNHTETILFIGRMMYPLNESK